MRALSTALLGMIAYVAKFIPMLSELNAPLRALKQQDEWYWTGVEQAAYDNIKKELTSNRDSSITTSKHQYSSRSIPAQKD